MTIALAGLIIAVLLFGWRARTWFEDKWQQFDKRIFEEIGSLRADMQKSLSSQRRENNETLSAVRAEVKELRDNLSKHETYSARTYATKDGVRDGLAALLRQVEASERGRSADASELKAIVKEALRKRD